MSGTAAWHPRLLNPWGWSWWKRTNWPLSGLEAWNLQDKIYSCHCWQPCTCITSLSDNHGEWCAPPWAERWGHYLHLLPCNSCSFTYHYRLQKQMFLEVAGTSRILFVLALQMVVVVVVIVVSAVLLVAIAVVVVVVAVAVAAAAAVAAVLLLLLSLSRYFGERCVLWKCLPSYTWFIVFCNVFHFFVKN